MALFESYERRINQINACLNENGIKDLQEAEQICKDHGLDVYNLVKGIQTICFENACWAYTVGAALALKNKAANADEYHDILNNLLKKGPPCLGVDRPEAIFEPL
jgi:hypothetical protein